MFCCLYFSGRGGTKYSVVSTRAARGGTRGRGFAPTGRTMPTQRVQVYNVPVCRVLLFCSKRLLFALIRTCVFASLCEWLRIQDRFSMYAVGETKYTCGEFPIYSRPYVNSHRCPHRNSTATAPEEWGAAETLRSVAVVRRGEVTALTNRWSTIRTGLVGDVGAPWKIHPSECMFIYLFFSKINCRFLLGNVTWEWWPDGFKMRKSIHFFQRFIWSFKVCNWNCSVHSDLWDFSHRCQAWKAYLLRQVSVNICSSRVL